MENHTSGFVTNESDSWEADWWEMCSNFLIKNGSFFLIFILKKKKKVCPTTNIIECFLKQIKILLRQQCEAVSCAASWLNLSGIKDVVALSP